MITSTLAQAKKSAVSGSQDVETDSASLVSEITRRAAALPQHDLEELYGAIAGWLGREPSSSGSGSISSRGRAKGWIEVQYKHRKVRGEIVERNAYGPYYVRGFWGPTKDGKRKKIKVYLGASPTGQASHKGAK